MAWNPQLTTPGTNWQGNQPVATLRQLNSSIGITSTAFNALYDYTTFEVSTLQAQIDGLVLSTGGTTATWASFPALTNVNINSKNITGVSSITAILFSGPLTGNVTGNLTGNSAGTHTGPVSGNVTGNTSGTHTGNVVGNISNTNLTVLGQYSITETADVGSAVSNYANYGTVNISGKGGLGGIVNITADVATPLNPAVTVSQLTMEAKGNYGLITPGTPVGYIPRGGLVSITARQGLTPNPPAEVTSGLFGNGEIDLTAYSYGAVPGLIKMSAGANAMYAGAFSPITGIFGNNYIAATVANTMTAGLPPGGIPTLVGTNYFYAVLGVGGAGSQIVGNRFQGGVGMDFLQPFPNGDLIIQSNLNGTDTVVISGVKSLAMSNGGNITGVGNLNVNTLNSVITVTSSNLCNVGQFRANNGIFNNAISVTNNGSFGSINTGTLAANSATVTTSIDANSANITLGINGGSATITNTVQAGSFFTTGTANLAFLTVPNNTTTNSLTVTTNTTTNNLTVSNTTTTTTLNNSGITTSASVSTNNLSTAASFISSINGIDINAFGGSATTLPFLSTNSISSGNAFIGTISSSSMSTGASFISSINGINITSFGGSSTTLPSLSTNSISAATASISSVFTNNLSTAVANISSLSVYGNLVFLTAAKGYDISKTLTSTVTNYDLVSSLTQDIFGYKMNLTTTGEPQSFDMGSFFAVTDENSTLWSKKQITYSGELADGQAPTINIVPGAFVTSDYFDVKNIATNGAILYIWNPYVSGGLLLQMVPNTYYRFTYSGSAWTFAANPTPIGATFFNTFAIYQGWEQTTISTPNLLNIEAGATNIQGFTAMDITNINYLTAGGASFSTIVSPLVSSSAMFTSSINNTNINTILNPTTLPFLSTTNISTAQIKTSSITANTLTFTSPLANPTGSWDINRTFYSNVVSGSYDSNVSSLTAQILNYDLSATIPNIASFFFGTVFTIQYNDAQWASQFLIANSSFGGTIILLNASATNFFDCQNQSPLELLVTNNLSGSPVTLFTIPSGNLTIYRVTATVSAGVTTWSYAVSPAVYSTTTVANNLLISADLQNTYISSINRVQFNTGDVYFNSPIYAPNAYFNNVILNNVNASTLSAGNITATGISTNALSTNSITTNTLTTNSLITTALTVPAISTNRISSSLIFASTITASSRVITPSISTLKALNSYNTRLLNNPGNVLIYQETFVGGNGSKRADIDTDTFVPGVYTCSAVCRNNQFRTLEATLYYNSRASAFCQNSQGFDNYNGQKWTASGGFVSFTSQTDGPGDTYDISIYMISGQYFTLGDDPPFPQPSTIFISSATVNTGTPSPIVIGLSSLIGSTITIQAKDNISLLANIAPPAYISSGNITIAGSASVEIIGQQAVVGGLGDVDIEAVTGDVNISAASTISMTAPYINAGTAAIGEPSAFGSVCAYFGNSSRATNGSEYAILQENNGRTFLNAVTGTDLRFRVNNTDVMIMSNDGLYMSQKINMNSNNINNVGTISSLNVYAGTAVIGTPSAYGTNYAYFGNNSLAANGGEYALLQENNGRTFLNSKLYQPLNLRNGNYDIMELNDTQIQAFKPLNMNSNDITNVRTLEALSTQQIAIQQTAGSDFVLFNNGDTRMNAKRDAYVGGDRDVYVISQANMNIRTSDAQYITLQQIGSGNSSYFQFRPDGVIVLSSRTNIEISANGGSNNITMSAGNTEFRGNISFNSSNRYINNLEHIYGSTTTPNGGLAIDYMYGLFFNSGGRNANLYADAGNLNMINYNSGLNLATYNSNGTGNFSLYSASNDMYLTSGTGRDINLNGGRTVSVNAAQPGGSFGIYTSTINAGSLVDTNFNCGGNFSITGGGGSQYVTFQNAGTAIQFAGPNIYVGTSSGGFNLNIPVAIGSAYSLNMQGAPITQVSTISMTSNATITSPNTINFTAPSTFMTGSLYFNPASTSEIDLQGGYLRNASYITNPFTTNIQAFTGLYLASDVRVNLTAPAVRIQGDVDHVNCNVSFISQLRSVSTINNNIDVVNLNINAPSTIISGTVQRILSATNVTQPIIQYGTDGVSGGSGSVNITLDTPYTSSNSYVAFACMMDTDPAQMAVARVDSNIITISWANGGGGSHTLSWNTMGT